MKKENYIALIGFAIILIGTISLGVYKMYIDIKYKKAIIELKENYLNDLQRIPH